MSTIMDEIQRRNITRSCHFTKSSKMLHILSSENGIIAETFLEKEHEDILTRNDQLRLDGKLEHISCSIEYPNTWYLNRKMNDPLFKDWVILFIDPKIMIDNNTLFCHRNAAAANGAYIRRGVDGFLGMFKNPVQGQRLLYRTERMLDCCTTDGQAEVLIYKEILRNRITGIAVRNYNQLKDEKVRLEILNLSPSVNWFVAPDLFNNNWNNLVKQGRRPEEILV